MDVLADLRAVAVLVLEERALGDHHLCIHELVAEQEVAHLGVAGVGNQRNLERPRDLRALRLEFAELLLREPHELVLELAAPLDHHERQRRRGVADLDGAHHHVRAKLELGIRLDRHDLVRRLLALEVHP